MVIFYCGWDKPGCLNRCRDFKETQYFPYVKILICAAHKRDRVARLLDLHFSFYIFGGIFQPGPGQCFMDLKAGKIKYRPGTGQR